MIKWFKKWHEWQARCINGKFYKLMVLFKIRKSPSMQCMGFGEYFSQEFEKQLGAVKRTHPNTVVSQKIKKHTRRVVE